ncbi:MAG: outer membrane lipoprotein carrier protein LolA [Bacteroidetes bacterium]|nr:outer membrane lipoprotein carrier protein LolA [Bacteroidota bacterium]
MKKLFGALAILACSVSATAQAPKGMGQSDPDAKKILDGVSAKFKTYKSVTAKFTQKGENAAGKSLGSQSGMVYMKGVKYRMSSGGKEVFCDGSNVWTYDKSSNEVTISKLDPANNTITPQKLFTNFYDKDFLYKLNSETKGIQEVELTPIDKSKPYFKVLVYVNKATKTVTAAKIFEKTGNKLSFSVSNMNTTTIVADAQFIFDQKKYPGVEVVDLR